MDGRTAFEAHILYKSGKKHLKLSLRGQPQYTCCHALQINRIEEALTLDEDRRSSKLNKRHYE